MVGLRPDETPKVEARLLRALYELSDSAGQGLDPGELVKLVADRACELLHGDSVALYLWDEAAGLLMPVYSNDSRDPLEDQPLKPGQGAAGQALLSRVPVVVDDYQHWEHAVPWAAARDLQSVEAVPLRVADRPVGALIVRFYTRGRVVAPDEQRILMLLAAQVAPALEAARLYATSNLERQHERALREITQALAVNLDEHQVLDLAVRYSARLLQAPYARIWLLEVPGGELGCAAAEGFVTAETFTEHLLNDSTSGRAALQRIVNLANAPADSSWFFNREFGEHTGLGAYLGAGLWRAGESLGVLEVMRQTGYRFDGVEEQLLVSLANAVAVAVSNARTHAELRQRDAILEAVASAAEQLLTAEDWELSIDHLLRQLGAATGVSRVYIVPAGQDGMGVRPKSHHEWTAEGVEPRTLTPRDSRPYLESVGLGRWEAVLREGGSIYGRLASFPPDEQAVLTTQHVRSVVVLPVFAGPTWWGCVGFEDCQQAREWPAGAVEVLRTAASTLGAAILRRRAEAARLQLVREQSARAEAEEAQRRLAFLAEASQILASSLDYETALQGVAERAVPDLADACFVDIHEADGTVRRVATAIAPTLTSGEGRVAADNGLAIDPDGNHPVAYVLRTSQPLLFPDPSLTPPLTRLDPAFRSGLFVPLVTRAGVAGAVTWMASSTRAVYETRDLRLTQDLARRCALAIDNARLYREARAAIGLRDEFLSVAAHELKTPMTSLRGYAQLLAREFENAEVANPERARRAATTIQVQSDKLARLVAQLLDVSRIQSGKLAIERKSTDLSELMRDVLDAARNQLRGHTLVARLPNDVHLLIDPLRIEQVITNLIDNAIKYSPEGGQIDVSLVVRANEVRLSVRDRGVGVSPEHRAHIFDRFYQAHNGGPLTGMAGMGLGLYISRQIVELHGGTIQAEFPDEGGTLFGVTLPR